MRASRAVGSMVTMAGRRWRPEPPASRRDATPQSPNSTASFGKRGPFGNVGRSRCGRLTGAGRVVVGQCQVPPLEHGPERAVEGAGVGLQKARTPPGLLHLPPPGRLLADHGVDRAGREQGTAGVFAGFAALDGILQPPTRFPVSQHLGPILQRKRKPTPTVDAGDSPVQAALGAMASSQFQGRSSLILVARRPWARARCYSVWLPAVGPQARANCVHFRGRPGNTVCGEARFGGAHA